MGITLLLLGLGAGERFECGWERVIVGPKIVVVEVVRERLGEEEGEEVEDGVG